MVMTVSSSTGPRHRAGTAKPLRCTRCHNSCRTATGAVLSQLDPAIVGRQLHAGPSMMRSVAEAVTMRARSCEPRWPEPCAMG